MDDSTSSRLSGRTTSRNLSDALSFSLLISIAVSPRPMPFSRQNSLARSSLNAFLCSRKCSLSL
ncbi:hypothetical protein EVA_06027 [gut metagenome]|uniref:Uncharacterized protein n=1 Tax=gut metagenome TaxID=749906 RepID=J9GT35_9ZZZZ